MAPLIAPILEQLFGGRPPVRFAFWDGSTTGPQGRLDCVVVHSVTALTRMLWSPNELGVARAFVVGEVDIKGDLYRVLGPAPGCVGDNPAEPACPNQRRSRGSSPGRHRPAAKAA